MKMNRIAGTERLELQHAGDPAIAVENLSPVERRQPVDLSGLAESDNLVREALRRCFRVKPSRDEADQILLCMSAAALRPAMLEDGRCEEHASDLAVLLTYLSRTGSRRYSPNSFFDEIWYLSTYPDVRQAVLNDEIPFGFMHFVLCGIHEGRWPNPVLQMLAVDSEAGPPVADIDEKAYLASNAQARVFLKHFPIISASEYYHLYGRILGSRVSETIKPEFHDLMLKEFDREFYSNRYMGGRRPELAFKHYLAEGLENAHSPNGWFDESWYRAFYSDVRHGIAEGLVTCGYQHYLCSGREERRLPSFSLTHALEARIPGVTQPTLLTRIPNLEHRMAPPAFTVDPAAGQRIWFILPWINPDIAFGGHIAVLELLSTLHHAGYPVGIVCVEDPQADKEYFLWRESKPHLRRVIAEIPVINLQKAKSLVIGPDDAFLVYSVWDLHLGGRLAAATARNQLMLMAQEYEPAFHSNSSIRLLCERAYDVPHYPIINSSFLLRYFKEHRIGVFGRDTPAVPFKDYALFEHRVAPLPRQSAKALAARRSRLLVAYARPEAHAERNLFEVVILALRQANREGLFGEEWRFVGVGALSELEPIAIGDGRVLEMRQKMTEAEYHATVQAVDIGISLMYAPHPSVVPFELATTGAVVVTNTYENRSAAELRAICSNIVPASPSVQGVVDALREALVLADGFEAREANAYVPTNTRWEQSFPPAFIEAAFGPPPHAGGVPATERPKPAAAPQRQRRKA